MEHTQISKNGVPKEKETYSVFIMIRQDRPTPSGIGYREEGNLSTLCSLGYCGRKILMKKKKIAF